MQEMQPPDLSQPVLREYFTGSSAKQMVTKMDERRSELETKGYTFVGRRKVGRNERCPCGSGVKFKRCCLEGAQRTDTPVPVAVEVPHAEV